MFDELWLNFRMRSGPKAQKCCRFRQELSNAYLLAKFGFDTAENEPCKVCPIPRNAGETETGRLQTRRGRTAVHLRAENSFCSVACAGLNYFFSKMFNKRQNIN